LHVEEEEEEENKVVGHVKVGGRRLASISAILCFKRLKQK
jgi:hypothetical protein